MPIVYLTIGKGETVCPGEEIPELDRFKDFLQAYQHKRGECIQQPSLYSIYQWLIDLFLVDKRSPFNFKLVNGLYRSLMI